MACEEGCGRQREGGQRGRRWVRLRGFRNAQAHCARTAAARACGGNANPARAAGRLQFQNALQGRPLPVRAPRRRLWQRAGASWCWSAAGGGAAAAFSERGSLCRGAAVVWVACAQVRQRAQTAQGRQERARVWSQSCRGYRGVSCHVAAIIIIIIIIFSVRRARRLGPGCGIWRGASRGECWFSLCCAQLGRVSPKACQRRRVCI